MSDQLTQLTTDEAALSAQVQQIVANIAAYQQAEQSVIGQLQATIAGLQAANAKPNTPDLSSHISAIESATASLTSGNKRLSDAIAALTPATPAAQAPAPNTPAAPETVASGTGADATTAATSTDTTTAPADTTQSTASTDATAAPASN